MIKQYFSCVKTKHCLLPFLKFNFLKRFFDGHSRTITNKIHLIQKVLMSKLFHYKIILKIENTLSDVPIAIVQGLHNIHRADLNRDLDLLHVK